MRKILIACILFAFVAINASAKELQENFFVTLSPVIMITTDSVSAPSPVSYSLGLGYTFPLYQDFSLQLHSSFFTQYYLYDSKDEKAKAAEIENRTSLAFCALPSVNVLFTAFQNEKQYVFLGTGLSLFARYGIKANGVEDVKDEISKINSHFWSSANFFYPNISFSYNRIFSSLILGADCKVYFPIGSLASGDGMENTLVSLSFKIAKKRS